MDDTTLRMMQLAGRGYSCSQIMIQLALEAQGKANPDLVRAVSGLSDGIGTGQCACGVLTGGACVLGLYAGRGLDREQADERLAPMLEELVEWFHETVGDRYGGIVCHIITGDPPNQGAAMSKCGDIMMQTYAKAMEILVEHGFDPGTGRETDE